MSIGVRLRALSSVILTAMSIAAHAQPKAAAAPSNPLRNVYFGELHVHTGMSFDAFLGGTRLYPEDAYRYARGEVIEYNGAKFQRKVPLDFMAVTDHAEYLGQARIASDPAGPLAGTRWGKLLAAFKPEQRIALIRMISDTYGSGGDEPAELLDPGAIRSSWAYQIEAAEAAYRPGKFTTFVAYEWTAMPNGANLHRNVIFRGPKYPEAPFSSVDSAQPEQLWRYLEQQRSVGVQSLAIPHNSNVSDGLMFSRADSNREPMGREHAATRASLERLVEITQLKGTSETRRELSPEDEFANFELIEDLLTVARPGSINGSYVREAYGRGLEIEQRAGVNPFAFGLVGGTDYHNGLTSPEEQLSPERMAEGRDVQRLLANSGLAVKVSAGGLTGVWAESNTRESIFDALYRRETYGTSGTRLRIRLFAGFYDRGVTKQREWVKQAYERGVPMGGELRADKAAGRTPRFLVHAVKDPDAGHLDRVQIVKVWLEDGAARERVFDVLWAGNRKPGSDGKLPSIGSTVNLETATYTNDIGAAELTGEWQDPNFRADQPAVYYARVLEIPTPRWTTYLAVENKLPLPTSVPATLQERAWTSPVFYRP